jgi:hypothetical protein
MRSTQKHAGFRPASSLLSLTLGLALAGCGGGDGLPREPISGSVAVDGDPVVKGAILFKTASNDQAAMDIGGLIRDGKYSIPRAEGPVPGTYQVMITEEPQAVADPNDPTHTLPMKPSKLTPLYRKGMNLTAEVKPGQTNTIDFNIKVDEHKSSAAKGPEGRR